MPEEEHGKAESERYLVNYLNVIGSVYAFYLEDTPYT